MDKIRKHIKFIEKTHQYFNITTGEEYLSTTKFVSQFYPEFNNDEVARRLITNNSRYKAIYNGIELEDAIDHLKNEWQQRTNLGTEVHNILEQHLINILERKPSITNNYTKAFDNLNLLNKYPNHTFYPEMLLFSDRYKLAGQADLVLINDQEEIFKIFDYKTNQKGIQKCSYQDKRMFPPLEHLPDSNYYHYCIQLSLYAYLLREETGFKCDGLTILWVDTEELVIREYPVGSHSGDVAGILSERKAVFSYHLVEERHPMASGDSNSR